MLAPQPFFEPRGTPFSEFHRIRALGDLGHQVDLVTYPFGKDAELPGLRIFRCARPPFVRQVKIGPSLAKIPLDLLLAVEAFRRGVGGGYDAVHSHEEAGLLGVILSAILRVPHLYDMHSSLPQQLTNFAFSRSPLITRAFLAVERFMVQRSKVVIVICPALEDTVKTIDPDAQVILIENAPGSSGDRPTADQAAAVRGTLGLGPNAPMVLYTGTFEAYQGLDLLFEAIALVRRQRPDARLVLAGGKPVQVARAQAEARRLGIDDVTIFAGERPAPEIPAYLMACDALVSPRSKGTNTPLKIYQYLRAGRAIVATRLLTHTQVLDDDVAILVGATPREFADGILRALADPSRAAAIGRQAQALADRKYSYEAYLEKTRRACVALQATSRPLAPVKGVA
jgi:glycosyltransferase involved in cell wall biosynthesis